MNLGGDIDDGNIEAYTRDHSDIDLKLGSYLVVHPQGAEVCNGYLVKVQGVGAAAIVTLANDSGKTGDRFSVLPLNQADHDVRHECLPLCSRVSLDGILTERAIPIHSGKTHQFSLVLSDDGSVPVLAAMCTKAIADRSLHSEVHVPPSSCCHPSM